MVGQRLEVRLDEERRRRLSELAALRGTPVSDVVRNMIDASYEEVLRERRQAAVRRIAQLEVEDVPDPETLSKQLAQTYDTYPHIH